MKHSSDSSSPRYRLQVARAALPQVLFIPDLAVALGGVSLATARRAVIRGDCGPYLRIGRRIALRREAFLRALADREAAPRRDRGCK